MPIAVRAGAGSLTLGVVAVGLVEVGGDGIEDTHFMVMAGMGFDAAIMEGVNEDIKKKVGWFAYVLSALKSLMFPAVKVEIQIDDQEPTVHRARTVVVGNVGRLQAGIPLLNEIAAYKVVMTGLPAERLGLRDRGGGGGLRRRGPPGPPGRGAPRRPAGR